MTFGASAIASRGAGAGDGRARAFAAARRHSLRIRWARRSLAFLVLATIATSLAFGFYRIFGRALRDVSFEGIGIEDGRITMDKPRLTGARPDGGAYNIIAAKAMQDIKRPGDVDLSRIGGDITMPNRDVSRLSAESGHYEGSTETLDLVGDVMLKNSRYVVRLRSVRIEFKTGAYVSQEPVNVRILPDTDISADAFAAKDGGSEVHFEGHVRTTLNGAAGETP